MDFPANATLLNRIDHKRAQHCRPSPAAVRSFARDTRGRRSVAKAGRRLGSCFHARGSGSADATTHLVRPISDRGSRIDAPGTLRLQTWPGVTWRVRPSDVAV